MLFAWQARLAESEATLAETLQARGKASLLEEEVELLKQKLAQPEADSKAFAELQEENKALQESLVSLQQSGGKAKHQSSLDEVNSLRFHLADAQPEVAKFSRDSEKERGGVQEYIAGLENKIADLERQLAEANTKSAELESLKAEGVVLHEEIAVLRSRLAGRSADTPLDTAGGDAEDQPLQREVGTKLWHLPFQHFSVSVLFDLGSFTWNTLPAHCAGLLASYLPYAVTVQLREHWARSQCPMFSCVPINFQCLMFFSCCAVLVKVETLENLLARAVAEKNSLAEVRTENVQLREQVKLLEERLRESDAEVLAQIQTYSAEVEAFQASLDKLKSEYEFSVAQVPVGEMSWDFWSGLLLHIDALMLADLLTQVGNILLANSVFQIAFIFAPTGFFVYSFSCIRLAV